MRRRRALIGLALLAALALGGALGLRLFAGGPVGMFPGGALSGEVAAGPVDDWSFASAESSIEVESRARWLPYSQRSWFMVYDGRVHLLLPSAFGDALLLRIEEDPRVRLRVGRKLYDQRALPVTAEADLGALLAPLIRRQFAMEISGRVTRSRRAVGEAEIRIYRLEDL